MSSCNRGPSHLQLLSPKFFEQPPTLLPPSIFRQACYKSAADGEHSDIESVSAAGFTSKAFQSQKEIAREPLALTTKQAVIEDQTEPLSVERDGDEKPVKSKNSIQPLHPHSVSKKRKLCSSDKSDQETFTPKHDNQLLFVAENMSAYTRAAKQRWKKSEHLAATSGTTVDEWKKVSKVLQYTAPDPASTKGKGQLVLLRDRPLDRPKVAPPTCFVSAFSGSSPALSSTPTGRPVTEAVTVSTPTGRPVSGAVSLKKTLDVSNDVGAGVPTKTTEASFIGDHTLSPRSTPKPLVSVSYSPPVAVATRNNFDQVEDFTSKPHTTDNLRLKTPPTQVKSKSESDLVDHRHPILLDSKASPPPVSAGNSASSVASVRPSPTAGMAAASAIDTESDLALAQVLQREEYEVPGECVVRKKDRTKAQHTAMDCSSDFEIARRLQQELDAETAQSIQSQHHRQDYHHRRMPGPGRRLGRSFIVTERFHY